MSNDILDTSEYTIYKNGNVKIGTGIGVRIGSPEEEMQIVEKMNEKDREKCEEEYIEYIKAIYKR